MLFVSDFQKAPPDKQQINNTIGQDDVDTSQRAAHSGKYDEFF